MEIYFRLSLWENRRRTRLRGNDLLKSPLRLALQATYSEGGDVKTKPSITTVNNPLSLSIADSFNDKRKRLRNKRHGCSYPYRKE